MQDVHAPMVLDGSTGNDNIEVILSGNGLRDVTILGSTGNDNIQVKAESGPGAGFNTRLNIDGNTGNDKIQVDFISTSATSGLTGTINASTGDDEVLIQADFKAGVASATANLTVDLSTGNDKVVHSVQSEANSSTLSRLIVSNPTGNGEVTSKVRLASSVQNGIVDWRVTGGTGVDKFEGELVSQAATRLNLRTSLDLGGDNDVASVKVNHLGSAAVDTVLAIDMGVGNDELFLGFAGPQMRNVVSGFVRGNAGEDKLIHEFEGDTTANFTIDGGADNDVISMVAKDVLRISAPQSLKIFGGSGNDKIELVARVISGFGGPLIDAGVGFDEVKGFGLIRNAEVIV